ncbi:maleylpyruvate isomerase family mycothiol-dependent enzyme [Isoptericola sp. b490]|uniref:maleylpyruvate isomerase family mycothiol-dependent enzyme n=1 Tax=Actinotalea lenta TaxID=3064654 RepID=UPI002712AB82|nr:maleylpyruvate isomerase family mycothiol-dependent enzyme [Isoptericola sp. b490]MDO8120205.1 maleylpyruvate isomerase family mycothiol-dependent enzyme [Isoptericola sp. b490]
MTLDHLAAIADTQRLFAATLATTDPEAPVTSCGAWRVADLALHLGGVHWWAAAMALGVDLDPHEPARPRDAASLTAFYTWAAGHLVDTLAEVGDTPALTLVGHGPATFWRRRQLHETLIHLWDLQEAAGAGHDALPDEVWADAVAEVADTLAPRQVRIGRAPTFPHAIDLACAQGAWRLGPGGPAAATVRATARDLALVLWHRVDAVTLTVTGDRTAAHRTLALPLTP